MPELPPDTTFQAQPRQFKATNKARLGVVETVYLQQPEVQPLTVESRFSRWLDSEEQPYQRRFIVSTSWSPLDLGWLKGQAVGMLILKNEEGKFQIQPTEVQREEVNERVLELAYHVPQPDPKSRTMHDPPADDLYLPFAQIRPGESVRFEPVDPQRIMVRCKKSSTRQAKALLTVYPA